MTDLKTANQQLAEALTALESDEHEQDVRDAEAHRLLLLELDKRIGARIQAKLEAHRSIAEAWGHGGDASLTERMVDELAESQADEPVADILAHKDADVAIVPASEAHRALVDDLTAALERYEDVNPAIAQDPTVAFLKAESAADAWQQHHDAVWNTQQAGQDYHTRYGLQKGQITEPVLETSVAEKPQAVAADEQ